MKRCYVNRSLLTQSFNIVNSAVILLFSNKWVPGLTAEDNIWYDMVSLSSTEHAPVVIQICLKLNHTVMGQSGRKTQYGVPTG